MNLQFTVTLGDLIQLGGVIIALSAIYYAVQGKFTALEITLRAHADDIVEHSRRMSANESSMLKIIGDVQRLIGRMDVPERRTTPRGGPR